MKSFFALFALLAVSTASIITNPKLDNLWEDFKTKYWKNYESAHTESLRRLIWEKNFNRVIVHNSHADNGLQTYWLGINEYADMLGYEFVRMMNGLLPRNLTMHRPEFTVTDDDVSKLPSEVDWRQQGYVTPVKNQGQCGSCWAFSTTGSLEGQHFKKTKNLISLSEQDLVDCSRDCGNMGCNGGLMDQAFMCIKKHKGIMLEEDYPYEGHDGKCRFDVSKVAATVRGYVDVKSGDEKALQKAVATVGPISVAIDASHFSFQLYSHGVYKEPSCSSTRLDHGVLVVGYGTKNGEAYWLVKNSWGKSWGMHGYIMMARNHDNMCGIATQASYPLV